MNSNRHEQLLGLKKLCYQLCATSCTEQKRQGLHAELLKQRPHWSVQKREEQFLRIDQGEEMAFDMALPLPARDPNRPGSDQGVKLFWEIFRCQNCGRCCYTPGAGLFLDQADFDRIAQRVGKKRLRSLCRRDKALKSWVLKQPCPFYSREKKACSIYDIRPATCTKYPLHPPLAELPCHLAVDAFCPAARELAKETLGWWIICENNWARLLEKSERS